MTELCSRMLLWWWTSLRSRLVSRIVGAAVVLLIVLSIVLLWPSMSSLISIAVVRIITRIHALVIAIIVVAAVLLGIALIVALVVMLVLCVPMLCITIVILIFVSGRIGLLCLVVVVSPRRLIGRVLVVCHAIHRSGRALCWSDVGCWFICGRLQSERRAVYNARLSAAEQEQQGADGKAPLSEAGMLSLAVGVPGLRRSIDSVFRPSVCCPLPTVPSLQRATSDRTMDDVTGESRTCRRVLHSRNVALAEFEI